MRSTLLAALLVLAAAPCVWAQGTAAPARVIRCGPGDQAPAINAAISAGGAVQIAAGTCLLGSPIRPPQGLTLSGAGAGATVLRAMPGASFNMVEIDSNRVDLHAFTLDGAAQARPTVAKSATGIIVRSSANGVRLSQLEITGNGEAGIYVLGHNVTIADDRIHDNFGNGIYVSGVFGSPAGPVTVSRNLVQHNSLGRPPGWGRTHPGQPAWDGIDCGPIHTGCAILNNTVDRNDIILRDAGTKRSQGWSGHDQVIGNTITDSNQACIDIAAHIDTFEVRDNRVRNCAPNAITIVNGPRNGSITNNVVTGAAVAGIAVRGRCDNITVTGNQVTGARRAAYLVRAATNVVMQGNVGDPVETGQAGAGFSLR